MSDMPPTPALTRDEAAKLLVEGLDQHSKHLATLATGTIVLSIAVLQEYVTIATAQWLTAMLIGAWFLLTASVVAGILTLGGILHALGRGETPQPGDRHVLRPWQVQAWSFVLGVVLLGTFAACVTVRSRVPGAVSTGSGAQTYDLVFPRGSHAELRIDAGASVTVTTDAKSVVVNAR